MAKYSPEFKINIIEEIEENKFSIKEIAEVYGISKLTIDNWYSSYKTQGREGLISRASSNKKTIENSTEKSPEEEFQIKVIEDMKNNNLSKFEIFKRYNVGMAQIALWERKYLEDSKENILNENIGNTFKEIKMEQNKERDKIDIDALLKENKRLRTENKYLRKINGLIKKRGKEA